MKNSEQLLIKYRGCFSPRMRSSNLCVLGGVMKADECGIRLNVQLVPVPTIFVALRTALRAPVADAGQIVQPCQQGLRALQPDPVHFRRCHLNALLPATARVANAGRSISVLVISRMDGAGEIERPAANGK